MKKLHLDDLAVESFATAPAAPAQGGTVRANEIDTRFGCPVSYGGTCWISCWDTCYCDTETYC
ncbi:MAG: hypothetical protein JWM27_4196 [Gemmatimonadetes bacterium]|nr:hypothetical protein [Gemmatimonadota bacterium]